MLIRDHWSDYNSNIWLSRATKTASNDCSLRIYLKSNVLNVMILRLVELVWYFLDLTIFAEYKPETLDSHCLFCQITSFEKIIVEKPQVPTQFGDIGNQSIFS
jgi:hypothetical protein